MSEFRRRSRALAYVMSLVVLGAAVWFPSSVMAQLMSQGSTFNGGTVTGVTSFLDGANFQILNAADPTKKVQVDASAITTANTVTPFVIGGTTASPSVAFNVGTWAMTTTGALVGWNAGQLGFGSASTVTGTTTPDAFIRRNSAAASIQMGSDANGAVVDQLFTAADGITGTDIAGASLTVASGLGTGAAVSHPFTVNRQITKATGTTAQTYAPAWIVCPTKILSNSSATAQTIATITTTTTSGGMVTMDYANVACSGSTCDTDSGLVKVAWNNNAGTVAAAMTAVALQADSDATGTLAATPTATVATNVVSIKLTPTWVTIVPTSVVSYVQFNVGSAADTVVCQ